MTNEILFGAFPYVAFALAVMGAISRYFTDRFSYTSLSSQFLENSRLFWGSVPWHYSILIILAAHILAAVFPAAWKDVVGGTTRLYIIELTGIALGILALFGILVLILRRALVPKVRVVTTVWDWILLAVLLVQVISGVWVAVFHRWGGLWYVEIAVPWLHSLATLSPEIGGVAPLPLMVKLHMLNAFVLVALFPFTRLVHLFTIPLGYLWRAPQVVIWNRKQPHSRTP